MNKILDMVIKQRVETPVVSPIPPGVSLEEIFTFKLPIITDLPDGSVIINEFTEYVHKTYPE